MSKFYQISSIILFLIYISIPITDLIVIEWNETSVVCSSVIHLRTWFIVNVVFSNFAFFTLFFTIFCFRKNEKCYNPFQIVNIALILFLFFWNIFGAIIHGNNCATSKEISNIVILTIIYEFFLCFYMLVYNHKYNTFIDKNVPLLDF